MHVDRIEIYEDNSGAVYLTRGHQTWALGPVTPDMCGCAEADARGWVDDEWEPNEHDGQRRTDLTDLDHIATWTSAGLTVELNDMGEPVAGGGGARYLGIEAL